MSLAREEILIGSKADTRGFKKAQTAADKLNKTVRALGISVGAYAAADFAKNSVKAFIADEAAANKLALAVKNLGMEFANPYIANYISNMEASSKVADDQLRPAFQALLTTTGSLAKSQSILNTAIEASRGSSYDLGTVANDLSQAYVGNTKGLKKYYLGLDAAALKAASFTDIQKIMNDQFAGSNTAYLSTYSGQVGVLSLAWGNFQEKVGGTLLTLASFGDGENGTKLNLLALSLEKIGSAIELIGKGKETIANLFNITGKNGLLSKFNPYAVATPDAAKPETSLDKFQTLLAKIEKDRKKQQDALIASNKKLTAEQKKQAALKKAGTVFDLEQIQIVAALKGRISQDERLRLEAQLAILSGNADLAAKLTNEILKAQDASGNLAKFLSTLPDAKNPFQYLDAYLSYLANKAAAVLTGSPVPSVPSANAAPAPMPTPSEMAASGSFSQLVSQGAGASGGFSPVVAAAMATQVIELKITGDGDLTNTIAKNLMQQSLSTGNQTYVNRRTGGFE
jgi:hypothetical protein